MTIFISLPSQSIYRQKIIYCLQHKDIYTATMIPALGAQINVYKYPHA